MDANRPSNASQENRQGGDRRRRRTPILSRYWLAGQRRGDRRAHWQIDEYVDRYARLEWWLVIGILIMCMIDQGSTIAYLTLGGEEANPLMDWAWRMGLGWFIAIKTSITVFGMAFVLIHVRFHRTRKLLVLVFVLYLFLVVYHLALWWQYHGQGH